jgi:DNA-binding transcriptional MerR regulator
MERRYRVRDFARIVGVTVKALQHYDRVGVLKPSRTAAGHRIYSDRDVERVRQIIALKSIGVPLKRIKAVLDGHRVSLTDALETQRQELVAQRNGLQHVLNAIALVEEELVHGRVSDAQALAQLLDLLAVQSDVDAMRKYFSPEAWAKFGDYWRRERPGISRSRQLAAADAAAMDGVPLPGDYALPRPRRDGRIQAARTAVLRTDEASGLTKNRPSAATVRCPLAASARSGDRACA